MKAKLDMAVIGMLVIALAFTLGMIAGCGKTENKTPPKEEAKITMEIVRDTPIDKVIELIAKWLMLRYRSHRMSRAWSP